MRTLRTNKNTGKVEGINPNAMLTTPFQLCTNFPNNVIALLANQSSNWLSMSVNEDGPMYFSALGAQQAGAFRLQMRIFDGQKTIPLTSGGLHSGAFCGTGLNPYPFPEALLVNEMRRIDVMLTDISGANQNVKLALRGSQWKYPTPDPTGELRDQASIPNRLAYPMFYCTDGGQIQLAGNAAIEATVTILTSHDFFLQQISGVSTGAFSINIQDANSGESIYNQPGDANASQDSALLVGTNIFPFSMVGRMFKSGQKLIVKLTDTSGNPNNIDLVFGGKACARYLPGVQS